MVYLLGNLFWQFYSKYFHRAKDLQQEVALLVGTINQIFLNLEKTYNHDGCDIFHQE